MHADLNRVWKLQQKIRNKTDLNNHRTVKTKKPGGTA
jgi:hypothetical protein